MRPPKPVRTLDAYACPACGFRLWIPVASIGDSALGLYDDARFPGRCLLAMGPHEIDVADVEPRRFSEFMHDVQRAAAAIRRATNAWRVNVAILGNRDPHVHAHLIPRVRDADPVPDRSPWEHPEPVRSLGAADVRRWVEALRAELRAGTR